VSEHGFQRTASTGFSLFELLIVLVISTFVVALASTVIGKSLARAEGKGLARRLAADLRFARSQAITSGEGQPITFDREGRGYSTSNPAQEVSLPDDWHFLNPEAIPTGGKWSVVFYPDGSSSGGEIRIGRARNLFSITVDPLLGEVRVEEKS
jgi:general secretion pathway protein H